MKKSVQMWVKMKITNNHLKYQCPWIRLKLLVNLAYLFIKVGGVAWRSLSNFWLLMIIILMINSNLTVIVDLGMNEENLERALNCFSDQMQKVQLTFLLKWKQFSSFTQCLFRTSMTSENTPVPDSFMVRSFFTPPEKPFKTVLGIDEIRFKGSY